jgi:hypothetical protein
MTTIVITNAGNTAAITTRRNTTMTTEPGPPNRGPRVGVSALELRLYVAALLAAVYTLSWRAIGGQAQAPAAPLPAPSIAIAPTTTAPQRIVWIDNLPPDMRPAITLPAGWQHASAAQPSATPQPARVVRVPTRRVHRVRTRSS